MSNSPFHGFLIETVQFFVDQSANNGKIWFTVHKPDFERYVMNPARDFVVAMGHKLKPIAPEVKPIRVSTNPFFASIATLVSASALHNQPLKIVF